MLAKGNSAIKKAVLGGLLFFTYCANAQPKIGIGIPTPQAQLDVIKGMRMGGVTPTSSFLNYDSLTGNFTWNRSNIFAPANQPLIRHGLNQQGLYYDNGALEYRDDLGLPQFRTHWPTGDAFISRNLGTGRLDPKSPLHFPDELGEKIILYGGASANYGIGMQDHLLQIHADQYTSTIQFGYGSNSNFTELMRINGNGRVGIGTNDPQAVFHVVKGSNLATAAFFPPDINAGLNSHFNYGNSEYTYIRGGKITLNDIPGSKVGIGIEPSFPDAVLEVNGRINIRKLSIADLGGYYLNKSDNFSLGGLVGMVGNNIGLYGINAPASFEMNATTGALIIASNAGSAGQVLQSKGAFTRPAWVSPTSPLYHSTMVSSSNITTMYSGEPPKDIPGAIRTFTLTGNATILVSFNVEIEIPNGQEKFANGYVDLLLDNNLITRSGTYADYRYQTITGTAVISASAGTHTIKLQGSCTDWTVYFIGSDYSKSLIIRILNR